jgi:hypothetical protein
MKPDDRACNGPCRFFRARFEGRENGFRGIIAQVPPAHRSGLTLILPAESQDHGERR